MPADTYQFDVAISYAGEDRLYAEALADVLHGRGVNVFYDKYEQAVLWGEDLYTKLSDIYQNKSRFCILFISKHYVAKLWTKHELRSAQARALKEQDAYILPIRLDDTEILGLFSTTSHLDWYQETPEKIADLLVQKLQSVSQASSAFAQNLSKEKIIDFIGEASSKSILILGRFMPERKIVLHTIEDELRKYNYVPIYLDGEKPENRSFTDTIKMLASLSRFIIVDLTEGHIFMELHTIVTTFVVPVQPVLLEGVEKPMLFGDLLKYRWVLPIHYYQNQSNLLASLKECVIEPAEREVKELEKLHKGIRM